MSTFHSHTTQTSQPFFTSFDVDSICAFATTLSACRQGVRWFPDMYPNFNITTNVHLGLSVPPEPSSASEQWRSVPLHTIPHYAIGQVIGWEAITIYIFFPRLYKDAPRQSKPLDLTLLSGDQFGLWTDAVLLPAIKEATSILDANGQLVPDSNILQHLPQSRRAAAYLTSAPTELAARYSSNKDDTTHPRRQVVGHYLAPSTIQRLADIITRKVQEHPECEPIFSDFVFYFACKNTKLQFMASSADGQSLPAMSSRFLDHWERCFDDQFLDPTRVFVDLGKQVTATHTALP
jgi:hypothetical protein